MFLYLVLHLPPQPPILLSYSCWSPYPKVVPPSFSSYSVTLSFPLPSPLWSLPSLWWSPFCFHDPSLHTQAHKLKFRFYTWEKTCGITFWVGFISLNMMTFSSIHFPENIFIYDWRKFHCELGVVIQTFNPRTWEAEADRSQKANKDSILCI